MSFRFIGSVSSGTMRSEDLIPEFMSVLKSLDRERYDRIATDYADVIDGDGDDDDDDDDGEQADYCLEALFDALNDAAPPFMYFGAHEGDGADYGFWVSWDAIEDAVRDGDIVKVDAGDEVPTDCDADYILEVSDHGNATLCTRDGQELWAVV